MKIDLQDALVILLMMLVMFCCYASYEIHRLKDSVYFLQQQSNELKGGQEYHMEVLTYIDEELELLKHDR